MYGTGHRVQGAGCEPLVATRDNVAAVGLQPTDIVTGVADRDTMKVSVDVVVMVCLHRVVLHLLLRFDRGCGKEGRGGWGGGVGDTVWGES